MRKLLAELSGHDRVVTVPKIYIEMTGNINDAILLNQIVFYSDKSKRTDGFFYKTYVEWTEELCLTEKQVRYSVKKLKDLDLIETKVMKANGSPTVHYKLLSDNLVKWILTKGKDGNLQKGSLDTDKKEVSLTESTTESTTEINNNDDAIGNDQSAFNFYQQNGFGIITPHVADKMGAWIDDLNEELVIHAMKTSVENNVLRWNYTESILRDWHNKKFESVEQVEAAEAKRTAGGKSHDRVSRNEKPTGHSNTDYDGIDF